MLHILWLKIKGWFAWLVAFGSKEPTAAIAQLGPGVRVGSYRLIGLIARGGMGSVWRARHEITGQERALKVIRDEFVHGNDSRNRFIREMTVAAMVVHPNVVHTHDPFLHGNILILPMELIQGVSLDKHLLRRSNASQAIHPAEAVGIAAGICEGLQAIHQQGLIHRDLKPLNVMVSPSRDKGLVAKIVDFGIARMKNDDDKMTRPGFTLGSPRYMAPEQGRNESIDGRADLFAAGMILHEMLIGRVLHPNCSQEESFVRRMNDKNVPSPIALGAEIPRELDDIVARALEFDPAKRFQTAREMANALAGVLRTLEEEVTTLDAQLELVDESVRNDGVSTPDTVDPCERILPVPDRHRRRDLLVAAVLLLASILAISSLGWRRTPTASGGSVATMVARPAIPSHSPTRTAADPTEIAAQPTLDRPPQEAAPTTPRHPDNHGTRAHRHGRSAHRPFSPALVPPIGF